MEMDPTPAALPSASVLDNWSAVTTRLSGRSDPVKLAPPITVALVLLLLVATATDAPTPTRPPLTSGSAVGVDPSSSIKTANNSSAAECASSDPSAFTFTSVLLVALTTISPLVLIVELSAIVDNVSLVSLIPMATAPAIPTPSPSEPPPPTPDDA